LVWRNRPSLRAGRWLRLDFGAKIQEDKMNPGDDPIDFDDLVLRRARVGVDGELFRVVQFSIERELTDSSTSSFFNESSKTQWRDVWGEVKFADALQIRGGRFKIPFSRDQLDGEASNDFVNRSLGGEYLAPGRDTGGMVHGRFFGRALGYDVGLFEHDGDNSQANKIAGGDRTFALRVTTTPFFRLKTGNLDEAEIGLNFATTDVSSSSTLPNGLRGRTVVSQYTFFEPVFVQGTRRRWGADFDWTRRQFGVRAEYMWVTDQRIDQGLRGDTLNDAVYHAWYVSGAWVLTGERSDRAIAPRRPLLMGGFGAVQLAARYERLWFNSKDIGEPAFSNSRAAAILPNGDKVLTLGVNWYLNRWVKIQLNGIHEEIEDTGRTPLLDGGTGFWSSVLRFQFAM
jgi:phosphate-selective porin OprO and OprP